MKRIITLAIIALLIAASSARASVCIDPNTPNDPMDDICQSESPILPAGEQRVFLPAVWR